MIGLMNRGVFIGRMFCISYFLALTGVGISVVRLWEQGGEQGGILCNTIGIGARVVQVSSRLQMWAMARLEEACVG